MQPKTRRKKRDVVKCPRCGSQHLFVGQGDAEGNWIANCKDCKKQFPYQQTNFQGELMTCAMCGKQQQSDPHVRSDWRLIEVEERKHYVCTDHFPPDGSSAEEFRDAYLKIISNLQARQD